MSKIDSSLVFPDSSINCNGLAYANGKLAPQFTDSRGVTSLRIFKGAKSDVAGTLIVHPTHNAANKNYKLTLEAGVEKGFSFDYVVEDAGNVALATLDLLPDLSDTYKP